MDNENKPSDVPYLVWEACEARHERRERRHWIAHGIMALVIAIICVSFVWLWNQYDYEAYNYNYEQDGHGLNIIGDQNREVTNYGSTSDGEGAPED